MAAGGCAGGDGLLGTGEDPPAVARCAHLHGPRCVLSSRPSLSPTPHTDRGRGCRWKGTHFVCGVQGLLERPSPSEAWGPGARWSLCVSTYRLRGAGRWREREGQARTAPVWRPAARAGPWSRRWLHPAARHAAISCRAGEGSALPRPLPGLCLLGLENPPEPNAVSGGLAGVGPACSGGGGQVPGRARLGPPRSGRPRPLTRGRRLTASHGSAWQKQVQAAAWRLPAGSRLGTARASVAAWPRLGRAPCQRPCPERHEQETACGDGRGHPAGPRPLWHRPRSSRRAGPPLGGTAGSSVPGFRL